MFESTLVRIRRLLESMLIMINVGSNQFQVKIIKQMKKTDRRTDEQTDKRTSGQTNCTEGKKDIGKQTDY